MEAPCRLLSSMWCRVHPAVQVVGSAEDDDSDVDSSDALKLQREALRKKKESIQLHLNMLVHAVQCKPPPEAPCNLPLCVRIKVCCCRTHPHGVRLVRLVHCPG